MKTHAGKPLVAKNTTRVGPNDQGVTRAFKPGDNPSRPEISRAELPSVLTEGNDKRAEYKGQEAKSRATLDAELARQGREGDVGD